MAIPLAANVHITLCRKTGAVLQCVREMPAHPLPSNEARLMKAIGPRLLREMEIERVKGEERRVI
jgi:hypothetical protein